MLRDASGNRLYRRVEIKIIFPEGIFPVKKLVYKPDGPRKGYGPEGLDSILMHTADQLDQLYPYWEFRMIPLAPRGRVMSYVFSWFGYRTVSAVPVTINETTEDGTKEFSEAARQFGRTAFLEHTTNDEGKALEPAEV